jgi:hypothetical protein
MACERTTGERDYLDHVTALGAHRPDPAAEVAGFHGIEQVLDWMKRRGLCHTAIDIVQQDEFEYDFLLELRPGGEWLAFGVT